MDATAPSPQAKRRRSSTPSNPATPSAVASCFTIETIIKKAMFTFGDVRNPCDDSAKAVERVLGEQMTVLYRACEHGATLRGAIVIDVPDVIFAYRKDVHLLHRLHRRVSLRNEARRLKKMIGADDGSCNGTATLLHKIKLSFQLLGDPAVTTLIDTNYVDVITKERMARADLRTQRMSEQKYLEYHQARGVAFVTTASSLKAFKDWIAEFLPVARVDSCVIELLAHICYDLIAKITETAVTIRRTRGASTEEDLLKSADRRTYNPDIIVNQTAFQLRFREASPTHLEGNGLQRDDILAAVTHLRSARPRFGASFPPYFRPHLLI